MYGSFFRGIAHNNPSPKDHGSFREDTSASNTLTENPWDLPADPQISLAPMHYSCSEAYQNDYYIHDDKDDHKDHQNQNKSNSSAEDPAPNTSGQPQEHYPEGSATITSCVINLANTIVGAGMLGLPGALAGSGFVGGSILMILGATFSAHGLVLLSKAAQQAGLPSSFYSVAKEAVPQYTMLIE